VNERLAEVCQHHGVSLVVMFGSHARGTTRPDSDLDLGVLVDEYPWAADHRSGADPAAELLLVVRRVGAIGSVAVGFR